ncbi:MAG: hypothetical protein ACOZQL_14680 [Myxococcota bacterium]
MNPTPPVRSERCPPTAELEAFAAGASPALAAHVSGCAHCAPYVEALRREADAFARARPPELFLKQLARRVDAQATRRAPWWRWLAIAVPVAAALALVVKLPTDDGVTLKGDAFKVFLKRGDAESVALGPDAQVQAKDALRFSYDAPADGFLAVFDLDGADEVTVFFPYAASTAGAVKKGQGLLGGSVVLDAQAGPEWLVAVWAKKPFDTGPLAAQLRGQATRPEVKLSCDGCVVSTLRLSKGSR